MKLAILTSRYPKEKDPYNHMFVHVRAKYFIERGVDVIVFVPAKRKEEYVFEGVKVICDHGEKIAAQLESFTIAYLHLLNIYPFRKDSGLPIYRELVKKSIPVAMYVHGVEVFRYPKYMHDFTVSIEGFAKVFYRNLWHFPKMRNFIKLLNREKRSLFLFPSEWMKQVTEENLQLTLQHTEIIPNGIDTNHFQKAGNYENRHKIVVLRPLETTKYAVDEAVRIMKHLPEPFTMEIYGKGRLQKQIEQLIIDENLTHRVKINNTFIPRSELPLFLSRYGIFMATTRCDAQGVMMCEAMASGLLICSNPVTAIPEFVKDGETGILGETPREIAEKILVVVADKEVFEKTIEKGRRSMESIRTDIVGNRELEALQKLVI